MDASHRLTWEKIDGERCSYRHTFLLGGEIVKAWKLLGGKGVGQFEKLLMARALRTAVLGF